MLRTAILSSACLLALAVFTFAEDRKTATIQGVVTFEGEPVTEGIIAFYPAREKPIAIPVKGGK
jgi:hypothetical protein